MQRGRAIANRHPTGAGVAFCTWGGDHEGAVFQYCKCFVSVFSDFRLRGSGSETRFSKMQEFRKCFQWFWVGAVDHVEMYRNDRFYKVFLHFARGAVTAKAQFSNVASVL